MKIELKSKRYWECPDCGQEHFVEHLIAEPSEDGHRWRCDCGQSWRFHVLDGTGVELSRSDAERSEPVLVTLEMPPQDKPVRITLRGERYYQPGSKTDTAEADERLRYVYEVHSCPTNWLTNLTEVYLGDEADPHGLFKFVKAEPWDDEKHST